MFAILFSFFLTILPLVSGNIFVMREFNHAANEQLSEQNTLKIPKEPYKYEMTFSHHTIKKKTRNWNPIGKVEKSAFTSWQKNWEREKKLRNCFTRNVPTAVPHQVAYIAAAQQKKRTFYLLIDGLSLFFK